MQIDDASRYKAYEVLKPNERPQALYCCRDCDAMVGPMLSHRGQHDRWHERIDALTAASG